MDEIEDPPIIKQKNIFTVVVNKNNQLLVEEELTDISDLRVWRLSSLTMEVVRVKRVIIVKGIVMLAHLIILKRRLSL